MWSWFLIASHQTITGYLKQKLMAKQKVDETLQAKVAQLQQQQKAMEAAKWGRLYGVVSWRRSPSTAKSTTTTLLILSYLLSLSLTDDQTQTEIEWSPHPNDPRQKP